MTKDTLTDLIYALLGVLLFTAITAGPAALALSFY
jgi:hypothetical protein